MIEHKGFEGIDFTDWIIFKMIIKIYGEEKLIKVLEKIKKSGGVDKMRTVDAL